MVRAIWWTIGDRTRGLTKLVRSPEEKPWPANAVFICLSAACKSVGVTKLESGIRVVCS